MRLGQNFCLDEISDNLKIGHGGSQTMSLGQVLEKPCICSRGHIFSPIIVKLGQNVCLDEILDELESGSCLVKNSVTSLNFRITVQKAQMSDFRAIMALFLTHSHTLTLFDTPGKQAF